MDEKRKKKQIAKISVFITSVFVIFLSVTYAFINMTVTGTKRQVITSGNLQIELEEEKKRKKEEQRKLDKEKCIEDDILENIEKERLYNAVLLLPKPQKRRIYLHYFCELTYREIAKIEKCSIRAIQYSLRNALKNLKNLKKEDIKDVEDVIKKANGKLKVMYMLGNEIYEKLEKENRKEADKMNKTLQKNIDKRHKEEDKSRQENEKQRIHSMKKSNKHMEKVGMTPGKLDEETEKKGEKLEKENLSLKKEINELKGGINKKIEQVKGAMDKLLGVPFMIGNKMRGLFSGLKEGLSVGIKLFRR